MEPRTRFESELKVRRCRRCGQAVRARCSACPWEGRDITDAEVDEFVRQHPGGATLRQVANVFGLTRERIRQIEWKALRKLRSSGVDLEPLTRIPGAHESTMLSNRSAMVWSGRGHV